MHGAEPAAHGNDGCLKGLNAPATRPQYAHNRLAKAVADSVESSQPLTVVPELDRMTSRRPAAMLLSVLPRRLLGNNIRLTGREVERFTKITGFAPVNVRTLDDLDRYIRECKAHFWGVSEETRCLHSLLDQEKSRCLA